MRIISIANQKGGCGKTTTAINLSAGLARKGRNVLIIDLDPQGHAAMGLAVDVHNPERTIHDALGDPEGKKLPLSEVILKLNENLDIAPSGIGLSTFEQNLSMIPGREYRLKEAIAGLNRSYDYIIIDSPPSLGLLTFNSLMAATEVFVPVEMGLFSLHGISRLLDILGLIQEKVNREIRVKLIATMFDKRTRIARDVLKEIEKHFDGALFDTVINSSVVIREAAGHGMSIHDYAKNSKAGDNYMQLVREVMAEEEIPGIVKELEEEHQLARTEKIKFAVHAPEAHSVKIAGIFNGWSQGDDSLLERHEDGVWSKEVFLAPGVYQYKFLIDDVWTEDRNNPYVVRDEFGGRNSIIEVTREG